MRLDLAGQEPPAAVESLESPAALQTLKSPTRSLNHA